MESAQTAYIAEAVTVITASHPSILCQLLEEGSPPSGFLNVSVVVPSENIV